MTTLVLLEIAPFVGFSLNLVDTPLGSIGENVLLMQQYEVAGRLHRVLAVLRMRLSAYDATLREVVISEQGVRVLPLEATQPGILNSATAGQAVERPATPPGTAPSA